MKPILSIALAICAVCFLLGTSAQPVNDVVNDAVDSVVLADFGAVDGNVADEQVHSRQKRATCDLLSWSPFSGAACAAHCIGLRYKGGYCNAKKVCVCRN